MALVALSVIEQRYRAVLAVMAVLDGARVSEVAAEVGASRQSVHSWLARYRGGVGRAGGPVEPAAVEPESGSSAAEARVCELRRDHPRWGAQRILHELMRGPTPVEGLPPRATVHRILVRHGPRAEPVTVHAGSARPA
jgi:hypothetical protein